MVEKAFKAFEDWYSNRGKSLDPDTSDVPLVDKIKGYLGLGFAAGWACGSNYTANKEIEPDEITLANGRKIWIRFNENEEPFLHTDME